MIAVLVHELRLTWRDRGAVVWLLLGPILVISVISAARYQSGTAPRFVLPVVNEDQGPVARAFVKLLEKRVDVREVSRDDAEVLVRDRNRAAAAIVFPAGLSRRYLQGRPVDIVLLTDPAEPVGLGRLKVALLLMGRDAAELADPIAAPRLDFVERNLTGGQLSRKSHEQNVPGFSIMFTLLGVVYATAWALRLDASPGRLMRLMVAPLGLSRVLLAKVASRVVIGSVQMLVLLGWGWLCFDVSLGSSPAALVLVVVATVFAATALGTVAAALGRSEQAMLPLSLGLVLPLSAVSGLWWPLRSEPWWMQTLAALAFPSWSMRGLTDLVLRDRGLGAVAPAATVVLAQGAVLLVVGIWLFRRQVATR